MNGRKSITPKTADRLIGMAEDLRLIAGRLEAQGFAFVAATVRDATDRLEAAGRELRAALAPPPNR